MKHTKDAQQNSTKPTQDEELTTDDEDQHIQTNSTQKEPTQPTLGQIPPAQSFTLPIEHDPALHVELSIVTSPK